MKQIGIVFGCFIPMHKGHLSLIERALKENDSIILCVCGYDTDRGAEFIPFADRIELVRSSFKHDKRITICVLDDKKLNLSGKFDLPSWSVWCKEIFNQTQLNADGYQFTWYSGEEDYLEAISELYPNHKFTYVPRSIINISGTMIRKDPIKYKNYIYRPFAKYLKLGE